jgi:hypothetical protein
MNYPDHPVEKSPKAGSVKIFEPRMEANLERS